MKEGEARKLLNELFERHNVPWIATIFYPKPITNKLAHLTMLEGSITVKKITKGTFNSLHSGECWIEFYGLPSPTDVRHEFRHYLEELGVEYVRRKPGQ
ncbi:unnamed protein product [marine sediment metagenome]|uniref:Uncharacterized protein n=1 Tax=marine sediment metagenome TaxID=412755 RepID=X0W1M2_9ZZZZ